MSAKSGRKKDLEGEWEMAKKLVRSPRSRLIEVDIRPRVFRNMPAAMNEGWSREEEISVPEGFFAANHSNTKWLLHILRHCSDYKLEQMMKQTRTRAMFDTNKYYQLLDQPSAYSHASELDPPMFNEKAVLYMNAFGIATYLRQYRILKALSRQRTADGKPLFSALQHNYATLVNDKSVGDIFTFGYDYIILMREAYHAVGCLLTINWIPAQPSYLVYRRRYYQYVTPFVDWVDLCCNVLRKKPNMQLSQFLLQLLQSQSESFDLMEMKSMGRAMPESIDLRRLTAGNFSDVGLHSWYAGRKLLMGKLPRLPQSYRNVFPPNPIRPVLPNVMSAPRRFLCHVFYHDYLTLKTLGQILSVIAIFQQGRYFSCERNCSDALWHKDPLVFQVYEIIHHRCSIFNKGQRRTVLLREQKWSDIESNPSMFCWFHRFDILNCISLLFGILQSCLLKSLTSDIVNRICKLLVNIWASSEFIEPFLRYSFYDTHMGLTSLVNCVPSLQPNSVMLVLKRAPVLLTLSYTISQISDMFCDSFWGKKFKRPKTLADITECIASRKRQRSMRASPDYRQDDDPSAKPWGQIGGVLLFSRDWDSMLDVDPAEEERNIVSQVDLINGERIEVDHIRRYAQDETDFRYGSLFGNSYRYAVGRPEVVLQEGLSYKQSVAKTFEPPKFN